MQRFLLLVLFYLCSAHCCSAQRYALPYDNVPITVAWEEIGIAWKNPYDNARPNTAEILRPIRYANKYRLSYGNTNVQMNLAEFGVPEAHVRVIYIKPLTQAQIDKINHFSANQKPIIGFYRHEVRDVRTYTFKDSQGHFSKVHATPNHPFYVVNSQTYVPISKITSKMELIDVNGQIIRLVCPIGKTKHCGKPCRKGKKTWVYNVEVYQQHHYFVGKQHVLAHNPCGDEVDIIVYRPNGAEHGYATMASSKPNVIERYHVFDGFFTRGDGVKLRSYMDPHPASSYSGDAVDPFSKTTNSRMKIGVTEIESDAGVLSWVHEKIKSPGPTGVGGRFLHYKMSRSDFIEAFQDLSKKYSDEYVYSTGTRSSRSYISRTGWNIKFDNNQTINDAFLMPHCTANCNDFISDLLPKLSGYQSTITW